MSLGCFTLDWIARSPTHITYRRLLRMLQGDMSVRVQRETAAPPVFGKENAVDTHPSDGLLPGTFCAAPVRLAAF